MAEHRTGRVAAAERAYRDIIAEDANFHPALHLLGVALVQQGRAVEAVDVLQRASALDPSAAKYRNNLGSALSALSRNEEALSAFEEAARLAPGYVEPIYNAGVILQKAGRLAEAEDAYSRVLAIDPSHAGAHNNLGAILQEQGRADEALRRFETATSLQPDYFDALRNIASLHEMRGNRDKARKAFVHVLSRSQDPSLVLKNALLLPVVYADKDDLDESRRTFAERLEELLTAPPAISDPVLDCARSSFFLAYQGQNDRRLTEQLGELYRRSCPQLAFTAPHCRGSWRPRRRIRIGFLSRHFFHHTIGKLNRGLIARLPRDRFEVCVLSVGTDRDDMAAEIEASADLFVRLDLNLERAAQRVAELELDILHYTDLGMDPFSYFLAFLRLAPIQTMSWGHPVTSGLKTVDHFISWDLAEVEGAQDHYTEQLARFARMVSYYPRPAPVAPIDRAILGWDKNCRVYFCAQSLFKIHPDMDKAFQGIVERDPEAQIVLISSHGTHARDGLLARWHKRGIARNFMFVPPMSQERYRQALDAADAVIDTFPFSGGNSSLDAFAGNVPVVALPSGFLRGRVTAAMYRQMDIAEAVAHSIDDYAEKAVALAGSPDLRRDLSAKIGERNVELFDDWRVVEEFADFFARVVDERR